MDLTAIETRLSALEQGQVMILARLDDLVSQKTIKDSYSVDEVAEKANRTAYQVREWLKTGRLIGTKRAVGRGRQKEWEVSHEELTRYLSHGLRPLSRVAC